MSGPSRPGLDVFLAALRGDEAAAATILVSYVHVLADRVGALVSDTAQVGSDAAGHRRGVVAVALQRCGELPAGELGALTWPPVAARLLGRVVEQDPAVVVADLEAGARAVLGEPVVLQDPWWLRGRAPGTTAVTTVVPWDDGFAVLERLGAAAFTRTFTRTLTARAGEDPALEGSWSSDEVIGSTVLMAPQRLDVPFVAESLLHEAVHHCQGMYEVAGGAFVRDAALVTRSQRYASPWTGQALTAKSLLAAVFVWYVLALSWSGDAAHRHRADRAARGFIAGDPAGSVASFGWALDPEVPPLVASLESEIRGRFGR